MLAQTTNIQFVINQLIREGWTERTIAKAIGVTQPTIYGWRFKKSPDNLTPIKKLAGIAKVSLDELLGGPEQRTKKHRPEIAQRVHRFESLLVEARRPDRVQLRPMQEESTFLDLVDGCLSQLEETLEALRSARGRGLKIVQKNNSKKA